MKILRNVAVLALIVIGAGIFIVGSDSYVIRSAGLLLGLTGVWSFRQIQLRSLNAPLSKAQSPKQGGRTSGNKPLFEEKTGPGRLAWAVAGGGVATFLIAYYFLVLDAQNGHHQAWPVYLFFASVWICIVGIGYLISKLR